MAEEHLGDDSTTTEFLVLLGSIVIEWSRVERAIDIALVGGRQFAPKFYRRGNPPGAFKEKLDAMRAILKRLPALSGNLKWANARLDEMENLARDRNTIIHGYFHGISENADPEICFRSARYNSNETIGKKLLATRTELRGFLEKVKKADFDCMMLMMAMRQEYSKARRSP